MDRITLDTGGFRSQVYLCGDPDAEPVFLLHDGMYGSDALTAWEQCAPLLKDRFRVIAPDLLGFGGSDKVVFFDRAPYVPRLDQLEAIYSALAINGPCHLVGSSFGGSLALRALERARLPLASTTAISGTGGPWRTPEGKRALNDYAEPGIDAMGRLLSLVVEPYAGFQELVEQRFRNSMLPGHYEAIAAMGLRNPAQSGATQPVDPYPGTLASVTTPVLLVAGQTDRLLESNWIRELAACLPCSPVETATLSTGHCPNIDRPGETADVVRAFLIRHSASP